MTLRLPAGAGFDHVEDWVFDLDNTLYDAEKKVFDLVATRMTDFVAQTLKVDSLEAARLRKHYYKAYGTTLRGLMTEHNLDPSDFLNYVHDIDYSLVAPCAITQEGLTRLLGRKVELVIADSASDWSQAAAGAEHLITAEGVEALFGCWTSSCRKALLPVVERHHHVLFYPLQYEGLENSSHIVYMGAAPNQQIIPGARWASERFGPRSLRPSSGARDQDGGTGAHRGREAPPDRGQVHPVAVMAGDHGQAGQAAFGRLALQDDRRGPEKARVQPLGQGLRHPAPPETAPRKP